jgi:hypothetical protein
LPFYIKYLGNRIKVIELQFKRQKVRIKTIIIFETVDPFCTK